MIEAIYIAAADRAGQQSVDEVRAEAGAGLVGDRYHGRGDWPGQNITLVEAEEIERLGQRLGHSLSLQATRRNVVTRGVRLNELVGVEFQLGEVRLRGVELCEPCAQLGQRLSDDGASPAAVVKALTHRAGLRADILAGGCLRVGMAVNPVAED